MTLDGASWRTIELEGADLRIDAGWLTSEAAAHLQQQLRDNVAWETHRIRMFGRMVDSPRLSCWIGDPDAAYTYSGTRFAPHPWPSALQALRARLAEETGVAFNSVLANRYRDGHDAMGWHSDDERELGERPMIASVSLGATRRFLLKPRSASIDGAADSATSRIALDLPHGSLLLMGGDTQKNYKHALLRTAKPVGERINLTFRKIVVAGRR